jgi:hypothetical protein
MGNAISCRTMIRRRQSASSGVTPGGSGRRSATVRQSRIGSHTGQTSTGRARKVDGGVDVDVAVQVNGWGNVDVIIKGNEQTRSSLFVA